MERQNTSCMYVSNMLGLPNIARPLPRDVRASASSLFFQTLTPLFQSPLATNPPAYYIQPAATNHPLTLIFKSVIQVSSWCPADT
jgi:hypothetical protein